MNPGSAPLSALGPRSERVCGRGRAGSHARSGQQRPRAPRRLRTPPAPPPRSPARQENEPKGLSGWCPSLLQQRRAPAPRPAAPHFEARCARALRSRLRLLASPKTRVDLPSRRAFGQACRSAEWSPLAASQRETLSGVSSKFKPSLHDSALVSTQPPEGKPILGACVS